MPLTLAWLRRDLRLHDHAVLATALAEQGQVQPVFIFDTQILARFEGPADRRLIFLAEALCHMHSTLKQRGGGMLILHGKASDIMPKLAAALGPRAIVSAEDVEPATRARDAAVRKALPPTTRFIQVIDHLLRAPGAVVKEDGTPYKVFTPYSKAWMSTHTPADHASYEVNDTSRYADHAALALKAKAAGLTCLDVGKGPESLLSSIGYRYRKDELWTVHDAKARLASFIEANLRGYKDQRDFMALNRTSRLSPYLRFGLISIRECLAAASEHTGKGPETWIKELLWREFYAMILYHFPDAVAHEFQHQYRAVKWSYDPKRLKAFIQGRTGYPIVDAAMRQLLEEGWMHNRARMIVASFATKDLQLDWRLGEEHFAQYLMDYDLASNNGGWQWAASTGTDAQPYFRVFNPWLQSVKFDPQGDYIRRYVPELATLNDKEIHYPKGLLRPTDYPPPIVDHATARDAAIAMFKNPG